MRQLGGFDNLETRIKDAPADVYGLSVSAVDHYAAIQVISIIKKNVPSARIIVGGIHPTIFPYAYDSSAVDCVVQGEGEITFPALLRDIERGVYVPRRIKGEKPVLDSLPWVDRTLFDYRRELECYFAPGQAVPSVTMLAGRGCPYACNYCQPAENAVFGKPYRLRSPQNVIAEIRNLKDRYHFRSITFWDDTFTVKRDWVMEFCDRYKSEKFNATIAACSRADILCDYPEIAERLASVGLDWFVIGIESGSQRVLDMIKKGTTVEQNREAVKICHANGIRVFGTFMLGLPTETNAEAKATVDLIREMGVDFASPFFFRPIPGTGIYDICTQKDLILDQTKTKTIERTGVFEPTIKGVDYDFIRSILPELRSC
jgi:anaerobic magnesium-protoporphyrin IX monomethyl ester cyclase